MSRPEVRVGSACSLRCSPFGFVKKSMFSHVVVQTRIAAISKLSNQQQHLYLLDSCCQEGMEGAGVFVVHNVEDNDSRNHSCFALLLPPLAHNKDGESVCFSMAVGLEAVLGEIRGAKSSPLGVRNKKPTPGSSSSTQSTSWLAKLGLRRQSPGKSMGNSTVDPFFRNSIVYILNPQTSTWASGIVLTESGVILSCAHIVRRKRDASEKKSKSTDSTNNSAKDSPNPSSIESEYENTASSLRCFYRTRDGRGVYDSLTPLWISKTYLDVAVFAVATPQLPDSSLEPMPWVFSDENDLSGSLVHGSVVHGSVVHGVGYGIFEQSALFDGPVVTSGVIGKAIYSNNQQEKRRTLSILRSSASIHHGNSGGALVRAGEGLIALVIMNVRGARGQTLPGTNFSIPTDRLRKVHDLVRGGRVPLAASLAPEHLHAALDRWSVSTGSEFERRLWAVATEDAVPMARREEVSRLAGRKLRAIRALERIDTQVGRAARL